VGAELVPVFVAGGGPGPFERDAYEAFVKELIERTVSTPNVSGIALPLHGAGVVEGIGSLEADLCGRLRAAVGPNIPMAASFDLHGNVTQDTGKYLSGAFCVHDNPHVDTFERGQDVVNLLHRNATEGLTSQVYIERLPMLLYIRA
jgi:toxic protein SymE